MSLMESATQYYCSPPTINSVQEVACMNCAVQNHACNHVHEPLSKHASTRAARCGTTGFLYRFEVFEWREQRGAAQGHSAAAAAPPSARSASSAWLVGEGLPWVCTSAVPPPES